MLPLYFCVKFKPRMKFQKFLSLMLIGSLALTTTVTSCKKDDEETTPVVDNENYTLSGDITTNRTLKNTQAYTLKGYVYVKAGATLTIPAGTIIKSDKTEKGALIIEKGGKIMAEGTASSPIVFTSGMDAGTRKPGDWGGIIILGDAPTNRSTPPTIEGGVSRTYGGNNANDNSGVLKYVRIEYAGIAAAPNSEINGLTLGGVGAGTTIENIMVTYGNDDAYEFFGGTVNCKNLIAYGTADDDYDFDFGYTGSITNAISLRDPSFVDAGDAGNGIEADNDGTGTNATPYTRPVLTNFTLVGPNNASGTAANHNFANRWRRAVRFSLTKSILIGYQKGGFSLESDATAQAYKDGLSEFKNNLVHAVASTFRVGSDVTVMTGTDVETKATGEGNIKLTTAADANLVNPFNLSAPDFSPKAGSTAATNGWGAITGTDWTKGWTNWTPNATKY